MKTTTSASLVALCLLMIGCKDNLNPVDTSIYYHSVMLVSSSSYFQNTAVSYQVGSESGSLSIGSKSFFNVVPGSIVSLTVSGTNPPPTQNSQQQPPGLVSATIYVDNNKWQSSNGAGQINASATASGTIP